MQLYAQDKSQYVCTEIHRSTTTVLQHNARFIGSLARFMHTLAVVVSTTEATAVRKLAAAAGEGAAVLQSNRYIVEPGSTMADGTSSAQYSIQHYTIVTQSLHRSYSHTLAVIDTSLVFHLEKVPVLAISAMSHHSDQKHFTISEVAADWHELIIPQCIMPPSLPQLTNNWTRGTACRTRKPS